MRASAVILAGGKSKRLGRDKALVEIGGTPVLMRVVDSLRELSSEIIVVTAPDHPLPILNGIRDVRVVEDSIPGMGALGGLYTGLQTTGEAKSIVVGCDMPFLNIGLLRHMLEISEGYDIVVPRFDGYFEPLHAVYDKSCLPVITGLLARKELKILSFFSEVSVRYVDQEEIDSYDPRRLSFLNINTEEDLRRAIEIERGS